MKLNKSLLKKIIIVCFGKALPISLSNNSAIDNIKKIELKEFFLNSGSIFCNINFDDQCPIYGEINGLDYGGNIVEGLSQKFKLFLEHNPEIAITSFVIPNFMGDSNGYKNKYLISKPEFAEWVKFYDDLAIKFNIEYALHGYTHHQTEIPFIQSHTEFAFKDNYNTQVYIKHGIDTLRQIGWEIEGFRQPGWDLSSVINLPLIMKDLGVSYMASNSYNAGYNTAYIERLSNFFPTTIHDIVNFPQNIELDWPYERIIETIKYIIDIKGFISIKAHFVNKKICNCLSDSNITKLDNVCKYLQTNYGDRIKFVTLSQLLKLLTHR